MPDTVVRIANDGWRLAFRAIAAMPILSGSAFLCFLGCRIMDEYFGSGHPPDLSAGFTSFPGNAVRLILTTAIIASVLIAVHRFVILGEVADRLIWRAPLTYRRFVGWLLLLSLPALALIASPLLFGLHPSGLYALLALISLLFYAIVSLHFMLLFPAMAIAMPFADWRNAWSDSRGHAWTFLVAQTLASLPLLAVSGIDRWFLGMWPAGGGMLLLRAIDGSVWQLLWVYLGASVASRLFLNYAAALSRQGSSTA